MYTGNYCGIFWLYSDAPKIAKKVFFESEGGTSYELTKISRRGFGGPKTDKKTQEIAR